MLSFADVCCINKACIYFVNGDNSNSLSKRHIIDFPYYSNQVLEATHSFLNSCPLSKEKIADLYRQTKVRLLQTFLNNLYRKDSYLKSDHRIVIIETYISENDEVIKSIRANDSLNLYSRILNFVIKTKKPRLIDVTFWCKTFMVRMLPRRH